MIKRLTFKQKITIAAFLIAFVPLLFSYYIFIENQLDSIDNRIRNNLKDAAFFISEMPIIKEKLFLMENDMIIQEYTKLLVGKLQDIDIIVIADMTGEKYTHLFEEQIGDIFIGEDKKNVLEYGESYFSLKLGSAGETLRWFQPIMYNNNQVGFVMVGKLSHDIDLVNNSTKIKYYGLLILTFIFVLIATQVFSRKIKSAMLGMEPEEIALLYKQKSATINSVKEGIISLDKDDNIIDINHNCYMMFEDFNISKTLAKLKGYIKKRDPFEMKELIIQGKKTFVTFQPIIKQGKYLGSVITFTGHEDIKKIAREITGVDEIVENLRANVHEFKNNLHVIIGLMQLNEYEEAKRYLFKLQQMEQGNSIKFSSIEDYYVRGLLLSREIVAKERNVQLIVTEESFLQGKHNYVSSYDLVTILGNLIENAFESCVMTDIDNKRVEVTLYEDDETIEIEVRDNGKAIDNSIKKKIFESGVSSKGEGRGTGLYLVKNRVELYDGSITIEEFEDEKIFVVTILKGENS